MVSGSQEEELGGVEMFNEYVEGSAGKGKVGFRFPSFNNVGILYRVILSCMVPFCASHDV